MLLADEVLEALDHVAVPGFVPKSDVSIPENDAEAAEEQKQKQDDNDAVDTDRVNDILEQLRDKEIKVMDFEKDDDANGHMDFVHSCAMARADNYDIVKVTDALRSRFVKKH